ncbi:MAG: kynureninase [Sporichthyaceae bacterium]
MLERTLAQSLDDADPLADFRDRFVQDDPGLIYLDGNSLGRLPASTAERLRAVVESEWGAGLVRCWPDWIELPTRVGDAIGEHLLGARPGEVVVSDSTTVNLYKLAVAALDARPGARVSVTDDDYFPTDRYDLDGVAAARGLQVRLVPSDPVHGPAIADVAAVLGADVALVSLSHVAYRSGAMLDLAAITAAAHEVGALTLWDLSHSAGSVPVDLTAAGADLAVGCTYKYLNGGPGAPAFLYVRRELQGQLRQPIWGWFGQRDQFAMGQRYDPESDIRAALTGTPAVLGLVAVEEGALLLAEAGIGCLRTKGMALTSLLCELVEDRLAPLGFTVASPRDPERRGSHLTLHHEHAWGICRALAAEAAVVADYREPERLRLGPAPLYTRFVDIWDAVDRIRRLVESGAHLPYDSPRPRVT